jgi:hypothetical protein
MKKIAITFCAATILLACNSEEKADTNAGETKVASASATEKATDDWVAVDSATAMQKMMEAGTPGAEHAMLAKSNGAWNAEMTMWMAEGAPGQTSKAAVTNKMLYDGRYQQSDFNGDFGGMPFKGTSVTGYDKTKNKYFTTWMDNMSTTMMNMEGTWDATAKTINFNGKMICPANGKECEMKETYKIVDDNTHVMTMYGPDMKTGKEYKNMEIKFTRKG